MYELGTVGRSVESATGVCSCGISDYRDVKAKVSCHTRSGRDAMRGGESNHHQRLDALGAQKRLEIRSDECAVDVFLEEWLAVDWLRFFLDCVARQAGPQLGLRLRRHVLNV